MNKKNSDPADKPGIQKGEVQETSAFTKKGGGERSHLICEVGESEAACVKRHAAKGWDVTDASAESIEIGPDQVRLEPKHA